MESQVQEIKQHEQEFFTKIERAMQEQLADCLMIMPDLKERIIKGLRWALFSRDGKQSPSEAVLSQIQTKTKWKESEGMYEPDALLKVSGPEVLAVEDFIVSQGLHVAPIFTQSVKQKLQGKDVFVTFEYEDLDTQVVAKPAHTHSVNLKPFLQAFELRLTLPDVDEIFGFADLREIQDWQFEYIDAYEEWKWQVEHQGHRHPYIQIGGHGHWIQGSYDDCYIAQVNNDVGDCGSVYIMVEEEFKGWVDMH